MNFLVFWTSLRTTFLELVIQEQHVLGGNAEVDPDPVRHEELSQARLSNMQTSLQVSKEGFSIRISFGLIPSLTLEQCLLLFHDVFNQG